MPMSLIQVFEWNGPDVKLYSEGLKISVDSTIFFVNSSISAKGFAPKQNIYEDSA